MPRNEISPAQIVFASHRLNEHMSRTLRRFEKFSPIGLRLPPIQIELLHDISISQEDIITLSEELDGVIEGKVAWPEKQLTVSQLIRAAQKLNEPVIWGLLPPSYMGASMDVI